MEKITNSRVKPANDSSGLDLSVVLTLAVIFAVLTVVLFFSGWAVELFTIGYLNVSTAGLTGVVAAFWFGWYCSSIGRPEQPVSKHLRFSLFMAVFIFVNYAIGLGLHLLLFGE